MTDQIIERPTEEVSEIERHKYYLSERAGHDVGWEFAEQDWEANHADAFRREQVEGTGGKECHVEQGTVEQVTAEQGTEQADAEPSSTTQSGAKSTLRVDAADMKANTGFGRVLRRLFRRTRTP